MPYIRQMARDALDPSIDALIKAVRALPDSDLEGALNYCITRLLDDFTHMRYAELVRLLGTLEAVKLEFYRRVAAPYEDRRMKDNGDVYMP